VILGGPLVVILGLLFLPLISNKGQRAPSRRPWALATVIFVATAMIVLTIYGERSPWSPDFAAHAVAVAGPADAPVSIGSRVFVAKGCIYCHQIDGNGGQRGPDLSTVGDRLSGDQLIIRINNGGHNMPAFAGRITHDELAAVVTFLLAQRSGTVRPPAEPPTVALNGLPMATASDHAGGK
jgi:ubiquinol-cytochrome c reductase cytochrome b subunit